MNQQEAVEKLTTLKNILSRLPNGLDEKRASLKIVEEFYTEATRDYVPPKKAEQPKGFQKFGDAVADVTVLGKEAKVKVEVGQNDEGSVEVTHVAVETKE